MRLVSLMALSRLWFAGVIVPTLVFLRERRKPTPGGDAGQGERDGI